MSTTNKISSTEVSSFTGFMTELIKFKNKVEEENGKCEFFFRGQGCAKWGIQPSINRQSVEVLKNSNEFYNDLIIEMGDPNLIQMRKTSLLAYFQHYQVPTRLLDITSNPLDALYFAVEKDSCTDCKVFFFAVKPEKIKKDTNHTAQMKVALNWMKQETIQHFKVAMKEIVEDPKLSERRKERKISKNDAIKNFQAQLNNVTFPREYTKMRDVYETITKPQFVRFAKESIRMKGQQAAFILPSYVTGYEDKIDEMNEELNIENLDECMEIFECTIAGSKKAEIRNDLQLFGINSGLVYPDIEHKSNYLLNKIAGM